MTVIQKNIGRLPVNLEDYDSSRAYGKKNRVNLYGCEWESKVDNNTYAPATLVGGVVTPDTTHWKLNAGVPGNYGLDTDVANLQTALSTESERAQAAESAEATRAQAAESALQNNIEALTQSNIVVVADHTSVSNPDPYTIYREQGTNTYSDWMYQNGSWNKMAEYDNAIDDEPTAGSNNLVKSGGVAKIAQDLLNYQGINVIRNYVEGEKKNGQLFNTNTKQYETWGGTTESLTITSGFVIGQDYLFNGLNYSISAFKPVSFLDSSDNIIEAYYEDDNLNNRFERILKVPAGTSKIVINGNLGNNDTSAGMCLLVEDYNYSLNMAKAQLNANCFKIAGSGIYANGGYSTSNYSVFYGSPIQVIDGNTLTIQANAEFHLAYYSDLSVFTPQTCVGYTAVSTGYDNYVTKVPVGAKVAIITVINNTDIRVINTNKSINDECLIPVKQLRGRELALDYSLNLKYDTVKNLGTYGTFAPVIFDENKYIFASHANYKLIGYLNCGIGVEDVFISINTDSAGKLLTLFWLSYNNTVRYKNYSLVFSEYPESDFLIYKTEYDKINNNIIVSGIDQNANKIQAVAKIEGSTEDETAYLQGLCKNCIKCSGFVAYSGNNYISYGVYNTLGEGWTKYKGYELTKWQSKTGVVFGDSLTAQGYYVRPLSQSFGMQIENCAVGGTCYTDGLSPELQPIYTQIAGAQTESPDFVFIMGGTNDYSLQDEIGDYQDVTDDTVCGGCYLAFSAIRQKWPLVPVFVGLIPYRDTGATYPQTPAGIDGNDANHTLLKYNNAIEVMARRFGFNVVDSMQCGIGPGNIGTYYQDGLHFNSDGGMRYAQFLVDKMNIITPY